MPLKNRHAFPEQGCFLTHYFNIKMRQKLDFIEVSEI